MNVNTDYIIKLTEGANAEVNYIGNFDELDKFIIDNIDLDSTKGNKNENISK